MKNFSKWFVVSLLVLVLVSLSVPAAFARAGGGGGGSGGGGGGGSSGHSSGSHAVNGYRSNPISSIVSYIVFGVMASGGAIVFSFKVHVKHKKAKLLMQRLAKIDPTWDSKAFNDQIEQIFYTVQEAWAQRNQDIARRYLSQNLYEQYNAKSQWMIVRHEKNILKNMKLLDALPIDVNDFEGDAHDYMWVYIKAKMVDYTVDDRTMQMLSGSKSSTRFEEYWKLVKENGCWVLDEIRQKDEFDLNSI